MNTLFERLLHQPLIVIAMGLTGFAESLRQNRHCRPG